MTEDRFKEIKTKLNEDSLEQVLLRAFPDIEIFIIRGFDEFSEVAYVHSAYFNKGDAEIVMRNTHLNGDKDMADTYHLIATTFSQIYNGKVYDHRTEKPLDSIDINLVYKSLVERLKEL